MSSRRLKEGLRPGLGDHSCRLNEGSRDELLDVLAQLNCLPASGACVRSCSLGLGLGLGLGFGLGLDESEASCALRSCASWRCTAAS